jgi:hypothetical protein
VVLLLSVWERYRLVCVAVTVRVVCGMEAVAEVFRRDSTVDLGLLGWVVRWIVKLP